jgi:tellurium resistance protein TerD
MSGINLSKGQKIEITQKNFTIGLGWTPNQGTNAAFDLDCSLFLLDSNKMIPTENHFVFYNNQTSPDGAVKHSGDDRTGANSAGGDDEQIKIDVNALDANIQEMLFVVSINEAQARGQNFGMVRGSYIRIVDNETGAEVAKYELDEDFSIETSIEFGRLYRRDGGWKFDASGIGYKEDLAFFVQKYYAGPVQK